MTKTRSRFADRSQRSISASTYDTPRIEEAARRVLVDQHHVIRVDGEPVEVVVDEEVYTSFPMDYYLGRPDVDPFHTYHSSLDLEASTFGCKPLYSFGEASYLSRAALLVPRAVGYSAGLVQRFFRGNIEAAWKKLPAGSYELKVTNLSGEWIGHDARIESVYRADPAYFGRTDTGDTAPVVSGKLADLVPGFSGLHFGQSLTIANVTPALLKPTDDITQFERRVVVTGTLGTEANTVIGLVQPAPPALVADLTVNCLIANQRFAVANYPNKSTQIKDFLVLEMGAERVCSDSSKPDHPANSCIERLVATPGHTSARVTVNSFDPAKHYLLYIQASDSGPFFTPGCSLSWEIRVGGAIVKEFSVTAAFPVSGSSNTVIYPDLP